MKRVNYLLSTVNLSFELLVGLRKGTIYRLLKKAASINQDLYLTKRELKDIAREISRYSLTAKEAVRVYKKFLKIEDMITVDDTVEQEIAFDFIPFLGTFFDKQQVFRL